MAVVLLLLDWFWLFIVLLGFIGVSFFAAKEMDVFALFCFAITFAVIQFWCKIDVWGYLCGHWEQALLWTFAYLPIGVVWSFIKWFIFLRGIKLKYQDKLERYNQLRNLTTAEAIQTEDWKKFLTSYENYEIRKPKVNDHKDDIIRWVIYWPFSIATAIVGDLIKYVTKEIYAKVAYLYSKMVEKVLGGLY